MRDAPIIREPSGIAEAGASPERGATAARLPALIGGLLARLPVAVRPRSVLARQVAKLVAERRFAQADRLVESALRWRPQDGSLLEQHAFSAHNSGRYALARDRWDRLRRRDPTHVMAWTAVACNLREMGRCHGAGQVALEAFALFPNDMVLAGELWRILMASTMRPLQEDLLIALRSVCKDDADRAGMLLDAEVSLGHLADATALVDDLMSRGSASPALLTRLAELAFAQSDWKQTITFIERARSHRIVSERLEQLLEISLGRVVSHAEQARHQAPAATLGDFELALQYRPDNVAWAALRIDTLIKLGRLDQAEDGLKDAIGRFGPYNQDLSLVRATLSAKRELWEVATRMLKNHLARFPKDRPAAELLDHVAGEWTFEQNERARHAPSAAALHDVGVEDDDGKRALLLGFESLGDNCEFGLVQRHFKAEPMGLFRWNNTLADNLSEALEQRLVGIGAAEFTTMVAVDDVEYFLTDRRWGFGFHTFCTKNEVAFGALYPKMCKRLAFLRDKFLDDLRSGEKTFVFKSDGVTYAELQRLHRALSQDAPVRLICVKQLARAPLPAQTFGGDVFDLGDGLYVGYVKRFGLAWPHRDIQLDDWVAICRGFTASPPAPFARDLL